MIRLSALLLLLLVPGFAEAQRRYYQPEYSMPGPAQDDVPEWAIKATCEVYAGGAGGTGGIFHFDKESKKCYVVTCRHVVSNQAIPLYVKLYDGIKREAVFLGYSGSADLALLEIDSAGVETYVELFEGDIYSGQEVYQVGYGINASRAGTVNKRSGRILKPSGYTGERSYDVSFMLISGDSGSPIFDAKTKRLLGVGWGHDYRVGKITGPKDLREFVLACLRKKNRNPPKIGPQPGEVKPEPEKPTAPVKPTEPPKPVEPSCKCPPPADLSKITEGISKLTDSVSVVSNNVGIVNKSVADLSTKVGAIDQRLVTVEGKLSKLDTLPPPSTVTCPPDPAIKQMQEKLAKLEKAVRNQSGTLHISVTPK